MAGEVQNLFWDSCVFYAFLRDERGAYDVNSIHQYLQEAKEGKHRIYASTIVLAEIVPSKVSPKIGTFHDFLEDLRGAVILIDPSPNVMTLAAQLKDLPYKKGNSPGRQLGTADAIILASCIQLRDILNVKVDNFHTFDNGKKRGPEGKMVPLISYEDWCEGFTPKQMAIAQQVIDLNRRRPIHPSPTMFPPGGTSG